MGQPELTVVVPAYNEALTIGRLLDAVVVAPYLKQVIVVDDGSTDETAVVVERWRDRCGFAAELVRHPVNRGKGAAIRTALALARGRVVLIQDADLEYDPADYPALVEPILEGRARVVYGSRYLQRDNSLPWTTNRICVILLNVMVRLLFGRRITDEATCYKAFGADLLLWLDLQCERFEFCPEVTAKVCRSGIAILEVPIRYTPRSQTEGKKIRARDGIEAITTLLWWRLAPFRPIDRDALMTQIPLRSPLSPTSEVTFPR